MLRTTLSWVRSFFFSAPLIILTTIVMGTVAVVVSGFDRRRRWLGVCKRLWARCILAFCFVRVRAEGLEKLDRSQNYIFYANHLSFLDPPLLLAVLPRPVRFLAKKSLFGIPFLGWGMRLAGDVPVDRENSRAAARSLAQAEELLRRGASLAVFPEGGRSLDGKLQAFLSGAFRLAIQAQVPVAPVAILGTQAVLPPGSLHIRSGPVQVTIASPIATTGLTRKDRDRLAQRVEQSVRRMLG